ncbi:Signal transduction histidine kinase [Thermomonospora echinospora]|uniref:histidine kinase n=1 Tax=Thermomonospora echinospora TaxID=1992 RepID=A0A1H5S0H9_9ACTN|nr:histidine kinase [Thermomonospora echinospora]SEF43337.1 Signal transduction histidine kinase [Thermomonospora echinospora]
MPWEEAGGGAVCQDRGVLWRLLLERLTWRRWAYLVMGGALLMPYWFLSWVVVAFLPVPADRPLRDVIALVLALALPAAGTFVTGLLPAVRVLEATAIGELVGGRLGERPVEPSPDWPTRLRTGCWFFLHTHVGVLVSALSLAVPPLALLLAAFPFIDQGDVLSSQGGYHDGLARALAPGAGLALTVALLGVIAATGLLAAGLAPAFLGPSPAERLAEAERRADRLAERNRLARELHDSVGHALSVVTLQAAAAGRVLERDPDFARRALSAIEESARSALADLDHVLGLLREEAHGRAPQATLADLDGLLDKTRLAGVRLDARVGGGLDRVPAVVSREAYRIVQEGLTNALRHAGRVPVRLRIEAGDDRLEVEMSNPLNDAAAGRPGRRTGGGRGLPGIRERVTVLRGRMRAGREGRTWRLYVSLPLRSGG